MVLGLLLHEEVNGKDSISGNNEGGMLTIVLFILVRIHIRVRHFSTQGN